LSRKVGQSPVLASSNPLLLQRFACARLSQSYLPESCSDFSATFTTVAFDHSSLRWFEINSDCRPRRTYLHLSYSYASPFGPALLVTQGPVRTFGVTANSHFLNLIASCRKGFACRWLCNLARAIDEKPGHGREATVFQCHDPDRSESPG
jgi:hypothetical protein